MMKSVGGSKRKNTNAPYIFDEPPILGHAQLPGHLPVLAAPLLRRIILANQPRLLREMIQRVLLRTSGLQVIAQGSNPGQLLSQMYNAPVHWLVVTLTGDKLDMPPSLYPSAPSPLSLLAISPDGRHIEIHSRTPDGYGCKRSFQDISLSTLLSILKYEPEATPGYNGAMFH
jgi:hypothetical protein